MQDLHGNNCPGNKLSNTLHDASHRIALQVETHVELHESGSLIFTTSGWNSPKTTVGPFVRRSWFT